MPTRRLLYLSAHQMTAYRWQAGALVGEGLFEATESGQQQFAAYLRHHPDSLFALLTNVAEEGFQVESIPFLRGDDRGAQLGRRVLVKYVDEMMLDVQRTPGASEFLFHCALEVRRPAEPGMVAVHHEDARLAKVEGQHAAQHQHEKNQYGFGTETHSKPSHCQ